MSGTSRATHRPKERFAFVVHISQEHCELVNDVDIPASVGQSEINQEFTIIMLYHRRNQCRGYEERKGEAPLSLLLLLSIRTNAMPFIRVHCLHYNHPSTEIRMDALKSGCSNIPVPFMLSSVSQATTLHIFFSCIILRAQSDSYFNYRLLSSMDLLPTTLHIFSSLVVVPANFEDLRLL